MFVWIRNIPSKRKMTGENQQKHFVLVHGMCHGAWCWYRLQSLLEAEGHRVTAMDLAASGINPRSIDETRTFSDYTQPLFEVMESIPPDEKVVLVGHSLGGMNIAAAMEKYPQKISVAVFIAASMPDTVHRPIYLFEKEFEGISDDDVMDNKIIPIGRPEDHLLANLFGPKYISSKVYQLCPPEDVLLAKALLRPTLFYSKDFSKMSPFSNERYGSVKRAYIITSKDKTLKVKFQHWLIKNAGATIVKEIDTDHMAMISKPHTLCQYLLDIAWDGKGPRPSSAKTFTVMSLPQSPLKAGWSKAGRAAVKSQRLVGLLKINDMG
ncbi:Hypothetical predicted protein [Olea europaea subsp. europaea]|uniref:AB hydrolase-1 domain-containing protein n=1 Tax=Olea europaea subsp. europaea TaxID=158383 RepID=A0A8S0SN76_OLEEU|nr:Hypothetical predicted protein [Olea europaea subsp. europaea]